MLQGTVEEAEVRWVSNYYTVAPPLGHPDQVKRAAELLVRAERPMLIIGKGVRWSEPTLELRQLVETLHLPFLTSPMGRGFIPDDHPLHFGAARSAMMHHADVIVVVGSRLNWVFGFGRQFAADATLIQIDIEPEEIGANRGVEVGIIGDAKAVLQQLLAELAGKGTAVAQRAAAGPWPGSPLCASRSNRMPRAWRRCSTRMPRPFARTGCCGRCGISSHARRSIRWMANSPWPVGRQVLGSYTPASRLNSGSNGCMGVGVPFAIGAKLARPEVPVVSINGDCAFGFNAMELETAVRCKLPIVFIVNNNSGIVGANLEARMGLPEGYGERVATYTPDIRYDKILEAFGGHTEHVVHPDDIRPALVRAYQATKQGQVACVNVLADPQESMATRSQRAGALMGYGRE